jgi:hypothetical protein
MKRPIRFGNEADPESDAASEVENAPARALELSAKDGSIVAFTELMSLRGRRPEAISNSFEIASSREALLAMT